MKSLNTSLPKSRRKRSIRPSNELLQTFKTAALSVTNLYRTAEATEGRGRQAGYQEALDDILAFLDRENIGLGDGEGWRIRQWATERLDDEALQVASETDDEEENIEPAGAARHISPTNHQRLPKVSEIPKPPTEPAITPSEPPKSDQSQNQTTATPEMFTFQANQPVSHDFEMKSPEVTNLDLDQRGAPTAPNSPPAIRLNVLPRNTRARARRTSPRSSTGRSLGPGAGSKRRVTFSDYFDLGGLDGPGDANKRGRMT